MNARTHRRLLMRALLALSCLVLLASASAATAVEASGPATGTAGPGLKVASASSPHIGLDPANATKPTSVAPAGYTWKLIYYDSFANWIGWHRLGFPGAQYALDTANYMSSPSSAHYYYRPDGMGNIGCSDSLMCDYWFDLRGAIDSQVDFQHRSSMSAGDITRVTSNYTDDYGHMQIAYIGSIGYGSNGQPWTDSSCKFVMTDPEMISLAFDSEASFFGTGADLWLDNIEIWALMPDTDAVVASGRLYGADRYATAVEISKAQFARSEWAVIATGKNFPDALSGACLASSRRAPLLLVGDTVPTAVRNELSRLGVSKTFVLGSTKAVSSGVESTLRGMGIAVTRLEGSDRYATAAAIARRLKADSTGGSGAPDWGGIGDTAIIATGLNFPDSLAGSPLSGYKGWPILLVTKDGIPAATRSALTELGITKTIVLGGPAAISYNVSNQLPSPTRLGGNDRYQTMGLIGQYAFSQGMGANYMAIATGGNYPDALAGSVRCALNGGVLLLTPSTSLCSPARDLLVQKKGTLTKVEALGGTNVVSSGVMSQVAAALQ